MIVTNATTNTKNLNDRQRFITSLGQKTLMRIPHNKQPTVLIEMAVHNKSEYVDS